MPNVLRKREYLLSIALVASLAAMALWAYFRPQAPMTERSIIDDINEIQINDPELRESIEDLKRHASRKSADR